MALSTVFVARLVWVSFFWAKERPETNDPNQPGNKNRAGR